VTEGIANGYGFAPILVGRVQAARLLSISVPELDRLRRNGELVARRKGRRVLFTLAELQRYVDTLPAGE
jgi:excisionase family DNA binding protein